MQGEQFLHDALGFGVTTELEMFGKEHALMPQAQAVTGERVEVAADDEGL